MEGTATAVIGDEAPGQRKAAMGATQAAGAGEPGTPSRERWAVDYAVEGDLRFISHHDTLRLFHRAFARAGLPLRYSEGFNPHPRLSLVLPRPVGIASVAEVLVVEFELPVQEGELLARLTPQMPGGITLFRARRLQPREALQAESVSYRLDLEPAPGAELRARVDALLRASSLRVTRTRHGEMRGRELEVRPFLGDLRIDERGIEMDLNVTGDGSVRPAEILELLELNPQDFQHRLRRQDVQWKSSIHGKRDTYDGTITKYHDETPVKPKT